MKLQTEAETLLLALANAGIAQGLVGDELTEYVTNRIEENIGKDYLIVALPSAKFEARK